MRRPLALVVLALVAACALAQEYPTRAVRIIVPYPPGGVTDIAARLVAQKLNERWGQPVVAENRPGAGAIVGVEAAARTAPDGYTLLMVSGDFAAILPYAYSKLPYKPDDLVPITMATDTPMVVVASAGSGIGSVADLVAAAKARPGEIGYGTPGQGTSNHLVGEWLGAALPWSSSPCPIAAARRGRPRWGASVPSRSARRRRSSPRASSAMPSSTAASRAKRASGSINW